MNRHGLIVTLLSAVCFGLYPAAAKMTYADGANASFVIVVTTFFRALLMVCISKYNGLRLMPPREERRSYLVGGVWQGISILGIIASLMYIPGPVTLVLVFTHTIMLLLFMAYRGEAVLTALVVTSTACALFGISLVVDVWNNLGGLNLTGIGLALMAALATGIRLYVFGKQVESTDPILVGARIFSVAFLFTLVLAVFMPPVLPQTAEGYFWCALCCLSLCGGTNLMFHGISLVGAFRFSLTIKLEPVFTAIFSILILGEILKPGQYTGIAVVVLSLLAYQIGTAEKRA